MLAINRKYFETILEAAEFDYNSAEVSMERLGISDSESKYCLIKLSSSIQLFKQFLDDGGYWKNELNSLSITISIQTDIVKKIIKDHEKIFNL